MTRLPRWRLLWIGAGAATAAGIAVVLALVVFAGDGGGGAAPAVSGSPTAQPSPTAQSSPAAQPSPTAADTLPPVAGEPRYTESGLGIIDIKVGSGEPPKQGQTVVFNGTLWLSNGPKVSSSRDKGEPYKVTLGANPPQAIAVLEEGLATMKVGGKRRLIIPPGLAFGGSGRSDALVGVTLIYDLELVEIK